MAKKWSWSLMRCSNNRNLTGKILVFWIGGRTWKLDYSVNNILTLSPWRFSSYLLEIDQMEVRLSFEETLWCFVLKFAAFKL